MDAIIVGIGTVDADDPLLTARPPGPRCPVRIVLDSAARLPLSSNLARTAREAPVLVAVTERATPSRRQDLAQSGCEVLPFSGTGPVPIMGLLEELGRRAMTNILVEGGGRVLGSFLDAGQVDAVDAFVAPILEGGDHPRTAARGRGRALMRQAMHLLHPKVTRVGEDILIHGRLPQAWRVRAGLAAD
jgi:diaminohydroxyphosphoribosylaminopyrimidine deaminase/5-amino-6-(5-phosphoribosylamino)uracil reductase